MERISLNQEIALDTKRHYVTVEAVKFKPPSAQELGGHTSGH